MRGFFSFLLDMLIPPLCVHCGSAIWVGPSLEGVSLPGGFSLEAISFFDSGPGVLCRDCWLGLEPARDPTPLTAESPGPPVFRLVTPFLTNGNLLSIVRFLKFGEGLQAADPLSWWMAHSLGRHVDLSEDRVLVTPVPLHRRRMRERGYNQAALLARSVAERLDLHYDDRILLRRRHTRSQSRLLDEAKEGNVRGAFGLAGGQAARGRHVVLVDDLVTSGNTARSCIASLLTAAPARVTVLAAGRRKTLSGKRMEGGSSAGASRNRVAGAPQGARGQG